MKKQIKREKKKICSARSFLKIMRRKKRNNKRKTRKVIASLVISAG